MWMVTKSLPAKETEAVRARLREVIARDFAGNQKSAAKKLGLAQSAVNSLLSGKSGAGMKIVAAVADYEGTSYDDILGRTPIGIMKDPLFPARGEAKGRLRGVVPDAALTFVDSITRPEAVAYTAYEWIVIIVRAASMLAVAEPPELPHIVTTPPPAKSRVRAK